MSVLRIPNIKDGFADSVDISKITGLQQRENSKGLCTIINVGGETVASYADILTIVLELEAIDPKFVNCPPLTLTNICGENTYRGDLAEFAKSPLQALDSSTPLPRAL